MEHGDVDDRWKQEDVQNPVVLQILLRFLAGLGFESFLQFTLCHRFASQKVIDSYTWCRSPTMA